MATEKQMAANRANAKKSTGPRTTSGRKRSSQNAYRHGFSVGACPVDSIGLVDLTQMIDEVAGDDPDLEKRLAATEFVRANITIAKIRQMQNGLFAQIDFKPDKFDLKKLKRLASLDRYERYARTKQRSAAKRLL